MWQFPTQLDGKMWKYLFMIFIVNFFWQFTTFQLTAGFLKDLDGDKVHMLVLFFLYVLQARLKCQNPPLVYFFYANIASDWIIQFLGHPPWPYQCSASYPHRQVSFFCIIFDRTFNYWTSFLCLVFSYSLYSAWALTSKTANVYIAWKICKQVFQQVCLVQRAGSLLLLLLPILHEAPLGAPCRLALCGKVVIKIEMQRPNMFIVSLF